MFTENFCSNVSFFSTILRLLDISEIKIINFNCSILVNGKTMPNASLFIENLNISINLSYTNENYTFYIDINPDTPVSFYISKKKNNYVKIKSLLLKIKYPRFLDNSNKITVISENVNAAISDIIILYTPEELNITEFLYRLSLFSHESHTTLNLINEVLSLLQQLDCDFDDILYAINNCLTSNIDVVIDRLSYNIKRSNQSVLTMLLNTLKFGREICTNSKKKSIILTRNDNNKFKTNLYYKSNIEFSSINVTTNHCCDCSEIADNKKCSITSIPTEFGSYLTNGHVVNILNCKSGKINYEYIISNELTSIDSLQHSQSDLTIEFPDTSITIDEAVSSFVFYLSNLAEESVILIGDHLKDLIKDNYIWFVEKVKDINLDTSIIKSLSPVDWTKISDIENFSWSLLAPLKDINFSELGNLKKVEWIKLLKLFPFEIPKYKYINNNTIKLLNPVATSNIKLGKTTIQFNKSPHEPLLNLSLQSCLMKINYKNFVKINVDIASIQGVLPSYPNLFSLRNRMNNPSKNFKVDNSIFPLDKHFVNLPMFKLKCTIKDIKPDIDFLIPQVECQWSNDLIQAMGDIMWLFTLMLPNSLLPSKITPELDICNKTNIDNIPERIQQPDLTENPFEDKTGFNITGKIASITAYIPYSLEYELIDVIAVKKATIEETNVGIYLPSFDIRADFRHINIVNLKYDNYPLDQDEYIMHFNRLVDYEHPFYKDGEYSDMFMDGVDINWSLPMHVHFHSMMHKIKYSTYVQYFSQQLRLEEARNRKVYDYCHCHKWKDGEEVDCTTPQVSSYDNPSGLFIDGCDCNPSFYNFDYLQYMKWKEYSTLSACGAKLERVYAYNFNVRTKIPDYKFDLHMDLFATYDLWSHWLMDQMTVNINGKLFYHHDFLDLLQTNENNDRIMGLYHHEILLREQAVSQRDGNLSNVMETVYGKYGWNGTMTNMYLCVPFKFEIQKIASEAVAIGIGLYEGIMKLYGRFQPRCQEYYKYWKWFPQDMFPNSMWINAKNMNIIFVDDEKEILLHKNLKFQKEEIISRTIENQIYLDYIDIFYGGNPPDDYLNTFIKRTMEASDRYYRKRKNVRSNNGLIEIGIDKFNATVTMRKDKANVFNTIQQYDEDILLPNADSRKPLIDFNMNLLFNINLSSLNITLRNQVYPIMQCNDLNIEGDILAVLFSVFNCFHKNGKISCAYMMNIPLSYSLLYPKVYGKIKLASNSMNINFSAGHLPVIVDVCNSLSKLVYYYFVYGNLLPFDLLRFMLHCEVKCKFDDIHVKLLYSKDPYILCGDCIDVALGSIKIFAPKLFYHVELEVENTAISLNQGDNISLLLDIPKQCVVLKFQYHKSTDNINTHYVFPFVYTKHECEKIYSDCENCGLSDDLKINEILSSLLKNFKTDYFKISFSYQIMKLNRPPVFEISLDYIPWLIYFSELYIDEVNRLKYNTNGNPCKYVKSLITNAINELEIDKIEIQYFECHIYEGPQHNYGIIYIINDESYIHTRLLRLSEMTAPLDLSVLHLFYDGKYYWSITNSFIVFNNIIVKLYNAPETFTYFSSFLQLRAYQYNKEEAFHPDVIKLFKPCYSTSLTESNLNTQHNEFMKEEFNKLRRIPRRTQRGSIIDITCDEEKEDDNIPIQFDKSNFTIYLFQFKTRINNDIIINSILPLVSVFLDLYDNLTEYNKDKLIKVYKHQQKNVIPPFMYIIYILEVKIIYVNQYGQ